MMSLEQIDAFACTNIAAGAAKEFARTGNLGELLTSMCEVSEAIAHGYMLGWVLDDFVDELRRVDGIESAVRHIRDVADLFEGYIESLAKAEARTGEWGLYRWSELLDSPILTGAYRTKDDAAWMIYKKVENIECHARGVAFCNDFDFDEKTVQFKEGDEVCVVTEENIYVVSHGEPVHFTADKLRDMYLSMYLV